MSDQPEALRLADRLDAAWHDMIGGPEMLEAAAELRRLHAEREADHAVMREALEALKYHTAQTRPITATQVAIHSLQKQLGDAAISKLKARVG